MRTRPANLLLSVITFAGVLVHAAPTAQAQRPFGIQQFEPNDTRLADGGNCAAPNPGTPQGCIADYLSDKFDGVDSLAHLTAVATPETTQVTWYMCPLGTVVTTQAALSSCNVTIGTDTTGVIPPIGPGGSSPTDEAYDVFWDIPGSLDQQRRDVVALACIGPGQVVQANQNPNCRVDEEDSIFLEDAHTGAADNQATSGEFGRVRTRQGCFNVAPGNDPCDAAYKNFPHGSPVPNDGFDLQAFTSVDVNNLQVVVNEPADAQMEPSNATFDGFVNCTLEHTSPNLKFKRWRCAIGDALVAEDAEQALSLLNANGAGAQPTGTAGYCNSNNNPNVTDFDPETSGNQAPPPVKNQVPGAHDACLMDVHYIVSSGRRASSFVQTFAPNPPSPAANASCANPDVDETSSLGTTEDDAVCLFDQFSDPIAGPWTLTTSGAGQIADCGLEGTGHDHNHDGIYEECHGSTGPDGISVGITKSNAGLAGDQTLTGCFDPQNQMTNPSVTGHGCGDAPAVLAKQEAIHWGGGAPSEVYLAFDDPAPTNASDPCRTGVTFKHNRVGDHDGITACTFDAHGNPLATEDTPLRLRWSMTGIDDSIPVLAFPPEGAPVDTRGQEGLAHVNVEAVREGIGSISVSLVDGNHEVDSFTIEKEVGAGCDEPAMMNGDELLLPKAATDIGEAEYVVEDKGSLAELYPGRDTTTDEFYPLPCEPSIGGDMPAEATAEPTPEEQAALDFLDHFEETEGKKMAEEIESLPSPDLSRVRGFRIRPCRIKEPILHRPGMPEGVPVAWHQVRCSSRRFLSSDDPFEGRDIVYVHGLATEHLKKWFANDERARRLWPAQASEYLKPDGYFREYADAYWRDHIHEHLFDPDKPHNQKAGIHWTGNGPVYERKANRYLTVAWSSNQTLDYAQHAFLKQIQLAMKYGKNVVTSPVYPQNFVRPFGSNGLIIVSHSTGALITTTALSRAADGDFGLGGKQVAARTRLHVSFAGAISGSRLATAGVAAGIAAAFTPVPLVCEIASLIAVGCDGDTFFVTRSILRDLMPIVTQTVWRDELNNSPVPTVTVAGGHPTGNYGGLTKFLLPGLDDGVVSMNSACGNPNPVFPRVLPPSGVIVTLLSKAFDLGAQPKEFKLARGIKNFISHRDLQLLHPLPHYLASACTPYLSPTGMVMPVLIAFRDTFLDARARYDNHYSFIQGSIDHSYDGGSDEDNPWPSTLDESADTPRRYLRTAFYGPNYEEMSAITDSGIYTRFSDGSYLVKPSFTKEMHEIVRGLRIRFKLFGKKRTWWIWKRTYHMLGNPNKSSSHYAYEYVGRR